MHLTHIIERTARLSPDAPAITCGGTTRTWKQVHDRSAALAGALVKLGLRPDDRVALLMHNCARMAEAFFGVPRAGGLFVPMNTRWHASEMDACLRDCTPRIVVVDADHEAAGRRMLADHPFVEHVILADDETEPRDGLLDYDGLLAEAAPAGDAGRGGDDLAALFYTGGTTGRSKGVMMSHTNLFINAMGSNTHYRLSRHARFLVVPPIFHLAAGGRVFSGAMAGSQMVMQRRFTVAETLANIERHRITDVLLIPTMVNMMFSDPKLDSYDLSSLEIISYGAAPMPVPLLRRVMAKLPEVSFLQGYGMSEAAPLISVLSPEDHHLEGPEAARLASAGRTVNHMDLRVAGPDGTEMPTGEIGEILVRGPNVMRGYWRQPELTAETLRDGWLHTGDAGYVDADGFIFLVDRVKDMIITGGENVYSTEVEDVLYRHPHIHECAVIGVPDDKWGEAVHVVVWGGDGQVPDTEEILAFARQHLAGFKCPRGITVADEPLPKSAANKILKSEIRARFWEQ